MIGLHSAHSRKKSKRQFQDRRANLSRTRKSVTISLSRFYDLSRPIREDMEVYPGEPKPKFHQISSIGKGKANVTKVILASHTGTHVDAPSHFIPSSTAETVNEIPLARMIGETSIIDMSYTVIGHGITYADLEGHRRERLAVRKRDGNGVVLIYTGTSRQWGKNKRARTNFSYLEPSGAQWLVDNHIKCVGLDSPSMEKFGFQKGVAHEILLSNGIGIIEGISAELKKFVGKRMFLVCLPLPLTGIDGSPVRPILFDVL